MAKLSWDATGTRFYETGVDHGVLFTKTLTGSQVTPSNGGYAAGVAWNGLTAVNEAPSGAEANPLYADNIKYLNLVSNEEFGCTIECYTYPDEFAVCDGSLEIASGVNIGQQSRKEFGFCYRTKIGNDLDGADKGYKLHIVYGCLAAPSSKDYATVNDSPEAITFSYEVSTTPVEIGPDYKPVATLTIDSTKTDATKLATLEDILYGTSIADPRLPLPAEIATIIGTSDVYPVSMNFVHVTSDNTSSIASDSYEATLTADSGYTIANVIVTMGGVDVTSTAYTSSTNKVSISDVTGAIAIIATANANT